MSIITFEEVTFYYEHEPDTAALADLSIEIEAGTMSILTGLSGSGKSTFCRLVAGYAPHQFTGSMSGGVIVNGIDVRESTIGELSRHVGVVFEDPFDQLTGTTRTLFDEVAFALEHRGVEPDDIVNRAMSALEKVGLGSIYDRHPRQLSGGQSQRLAIATVLALQPTILLLDSPTSQLDPVGSEEVASLVEEMVRTGMTIIAVAQDLERWLHMADRMICMQDGRAVANGEPRDVLSEQLHSDIFIPPAPATLWERLRSEGILTGRRQIPLRIDELQAQLRFEGVYDQA